VTNAQEESIGINTECLWQMVEAVFKTNAKHNFDRKLIKPKRNNVPTHKKNMVLPLLFH
jgi:hypothetical protein